MNRTQGILLWVLTCGILFGAFLPIFYLLLKGLGGDNQKIVSVLFNVENLKLLLNTTLLSLGVLGSGLLLAFPAAFILSRYRLPFHRIWSVLIILPLAIPGYIMALGWLSLCGNYGAFDLLFGIRIPRPSGYLGAWIALSTSLYPYLYLNFRAAFLGLNPALEESAKTMGINGFQRFRKVLFPQLKPALYSGMLLVALHVLGDFGVVSLMRFKTFSYALFLQYEASFDRVYAAWLALFMIFITVILLFWEKNRLNKLVLSQPKIKQNQPKRKLSKGKTVGILFYLSLQIFLTFILPLSAIVFWFFNSIKTDIWAYWQSALPNTLVVAFVSSIGTLLLAFGFAYFAVRNRKGWGRRNPILLYAIYSTPPLALGLALIFFTLKAVPFIYQTIFLLISAYMLHFLAEAFGPLRSGLMQIPVQLEEAGKSLGRTRFYVIRKILLPLLKKPFLSAFVLVFLAILKELPITLLLSPAGFETLATNVWNYTSSVNFGAAAPFALTIVGISALFLGIFED